MSQCHHFPNSILTGLLLLRNQQQQEQVAVRFSNDEAKKPWRRERHEAVLCRLNYTQKRKEKRRKKERQEEVGRGRKKSKKPLNLKQKTVSREESSQAGAAEKILVVHFHHLLIPKSTWQSIW